jgi:hypothetical protein
VKESKLLAEVASHTAARVVLSAWQSGFFLPESDIHSINVQDYQGFSILVNIDISLGNSYTSLCSISISGTHVRKERSRFLFHKELPRILKILSHGISLGSF